jgi:hypothetical protein
MTPLIDELSSRSVGATIVGDSLDRAVERLDRLGLPSGSVENLRQRQVGFRIVEVGADGRAKLDLGGVERSVTSMEPRRGEVGAGAAPTRMSSKG